MSKRKMCHLILVGIVIALTVFMLFYFGIRILLKISITGPNIRAYIITSIITGLFSILFFSFKQRISFIVYLLGIAIGFIMMYIMFVNGSDSWDGVIAVMYYFISGLAGLLLGLLIQLVYILKKR